jgi:cbb3-type cytochrome oxidase subunit 3
MNMLMEVKMQQLNKVGIILMIIFVGFLWFFFRDRIKTGNATTNMPTLFLLGKEYKEDKK